MREYVILTDATADHIEDYLNTYDIDIIPMTISMGDKEYVYGADNSTISASEFYALQREHNYWRTSAIAPGVYEKYFEKYAAQGKDIIYLCFSSGMSSTYQTSCIVADILKDDYPQTRITCIDTLNGSTPQGFLVREALVKKSEGLSYDEFIDWVNNNKLNVGVYFSVDTLDHLYHGGRLSKTEAAIGSTFHIKPFLTINREGKLNVVAKPIGMHKAMNLVVEKMKNEWRPEMGRYVLICHGDDQKRADKLREKIADEFPSAEIEIGLVDPIIGAHTGPGMISLCFWSKERE